MAKYLPRNTHAATNTLAGIVPTSWRGLPTIRTYASTAPTVAGPQNAQQQVLSAAKAAWNKLSETTRQQFLAIGGISNGSVTSPGSGYTAAPGVEFIFTTYNIQLLSGGSGYPDTPTATILGAGVFPNAVPLVVVNGAVELALDQFYITTGSGTPVVTITGGTGSGAAAHAELVTENVWQVVIDSGGSGYGDVEITWSTDTGVTDWGIVVAGVLSGSARRGSSTFSGISPPTATVSGTTGSGAALSAYFMLPESIAPTILVTLAGDELAGVTVADPGVALRGLPSPSLVGGGGSGGAIALFQLWFGPDSTDALGVDIMLSGFNAWVNQFSNLNQVGLPPPSTPQPYENAAPTIDSLGGAIYDGGATINVTNGGSGYSGNFAVTINSAEGFGFAATAQVSGGSVQRVNVQQLGFHYSAADTIDWSAGSGSGAAGTLNIFSGPYPTWIGALTDGSITGFEIESGGSGYTSPPTVTVASTTGESFTGTGIITGGAVTGVNITDAGHDYHDGDQATFTGGGGHGAAAFAETDGWKWWYIVRAELPPNAPGYKTSPTGWQFIGFVTGGGEPPDFGAAWLSIFASLPPGGAHIPVKVSLMDSLYGTLERTSTTDLYYAYGIGVCLINPFSQGSGYSADFVIDLAATFGDSHGQTGRVQVFVSGGKCIGAAVISTGKNYVFVDGQEYAIIGGDGSGATASFTHGRPTT